MNKSSSISPLHSLSCATMTVLLLLLYLSVFFLLFFLKRKKTNRSNKHTDPPGPAGLPLLGNLLELNNSAPHRQLWQLSKQYGPLMLLRLGTIPTLIVSSSRMARQVMKTHDLAFASRPLHLGQKTLSYNGLDLAFTPYSDYWREVRKLCVLHLFSSRRVQSYRPIREDEVVNMIRKISQSAANNEVVNLSEILMSFTNTLICRIAFSKKYEEDEGSGRTKFHGLLNEAQALLAEFYFSDYFPFLGWLDRISGQVRRLEKTFKELDVFYQQVIDDHRDPNRPKTDHKDVLDIFLRIMCEGSLPFDLTLNHIKALLMNIFIAGTDTVAATVVWAMTALMKNPKAMKKIQEEVRGLHGDRDFINEDDIERLTYLKAVLKETLRLFPPAPLLVPKETMECCNIDGYEIKPNTMVFVNAWAIGRDPENWEDPEEFYPERFFGSLIDFRGQDFELIPFGAGRRICPAVNMAVVTAELLIANLVHSFDWELPDGIEKEDIDTEVIPGITMHKKNALCLVANNCTRELHTSDS